MRAICPGGRIVGFGSNHRGAMRKGILLLLLAAISGGAAAEWVELGGNEAAATYADPDSMRKAGTMVKMWHLVDYAQARGIDGIAPYASVRMLAEYDCEQARTRTLYVTLHSANMGAGALLGSVAEPGHWRPIPPDTLVETLRAFACWRQ